ncbi:MAG: alpha/beta fold hydrolase [Actinobacteria bacterium]|nr:alpha/beta fold hydrolase [Actinomycetota bacterium]
MTSAAPTALDLEAYGLDPSWSHLVDVPSHDGGTHRWHLLDRPGTGPTTVLCLHGNPTWSYLWSRLLRELDPALRVIAPDHLGMGWSEQVGTRPYRDRVADVRDLLAALDVDGPVWIVAQDWGGAMAMGVAVHHPELVAGLVLSNTGIAVPAGRSAPWLIRLAAANGVHRLATRTTPAFVWGTPWLPGAHVARRERRALAAPYRGASRRDSIAGFVADVPFDDRHSSAADIAAVAAALPDLTIPVRLVWGSKDPVFNDDFAEDLRGRFADVALHRIAATGHLTVLEASIAPFVEDAIAEASAPTAASRLAEPLGPSDGIDEIWSRIAGGNPLAIAVSDAASGDVVSRREFESRVATYAVALASQGVQSGDRVAVLVPPGVDLIAVVYACWRIGAVTVVADRGLGLRGLGAAVRSARVGHVVGPAKAIAAARTLRWAPRATAISLSTLHGAPVVAALGDVALPSPAGHDPAAVVFTSGATGPAKGVRYTFGQLCAQRDAVQAMYDITHDDRFVAAFAPFAVFGPALGIATGFADMDVTSPSTLTASALDDACRRIDATMVFASPAALANVLATASSPTPALAKVRLVMSAGAPVPIDTLRRMSVLCPSAALHTPYGMTEVLPVADVSLAEREAIAADGAGRGVCVGTKVPGCEVRVLDVTGGGVEPLPAGVTGEVVVRTPWMSSGYDRLWRTQQTARPVIDGVVWHRTGDVGHLDINGNLWIEGRVVHLIHALTGAVSPVPIEVAAETVPGVRRAAAVGVGPIGLQQVVVVVEDGHDAQASRELAAAVRAAVTPQVVAAVWCGPLPVDIRHNAKIDRTALAATMERRLSGRSR